MGVGGWGFGVGGWWLGVGGWGLRYECTPQSSKLNLTLLKTTGGPCIKNVNMKKRLDFVYLCCSCLGSGKAANLNNFDAGIFSTSGTSKEVGGFSDFPIVRRE